MGTPRDSHRATLVEQLAGLGELESQVIAYSAARLKEDQEDFGPADLDQLEDGFEEALKGIIDSTHYLTIELLRLARARDRRSRAGGLRKIYLSHPPASESRAAHLSLRRACEELASHGCVPVCPQILFSVLLQEELEHNFAMLVCADLLRICDEVRVYGTETTPEMQVEIKLANALSIPVRYMHPAAEVA
jgi:hypothetical protein